jgi:hypothetical protein
MSRPCDHPDGLARPDVCEVCKKWLMDPKFRLACEALPAPRKAPISGAAPVPSKPCGGCGKQRKPQGVVAGTPAMTPAAREPQRR